MLTYIEVTGKTDEEALAKGLAQLGLDRDDVSVEILERGKAGFLGIGSVPARVKITYEGPDEPAPVAEEQEVAEIEEKVMAAFAPQEEELVAEEPVVEETPAADTYPEGNPFEAEPLEVTRRINLSDLKFGRNYSSDD